MGARASGSGLGSHLLWPYSYCGSALLPVRLGELEHSMGTARLQPEGGLQVWHGRRGPLADHLDRAETSVHERELGLPPRELPVDAPRLAVESRREGPLGCA